MKRFTAPRAGSCRLAPGTLLLALAGALAQGGCTGERGGAPQPESEPTQPPGHARMVAALKGIADRAPEESPLHGDKNLRALRAELERQGPDVDPRTRWDLHRQIGMEELRLGRNDQAIEHMRAAYELLPQVQTRLSEQDITTTIFQLGLTYMRSGETQNCVLHHTTDSCLLPIQGGGVHVDQEGSRRAIAAFTQVLTIAPGHLSSRWLLNIAYMTIGGYPAQVPPAHLIPPETFASEEPFPRFRDIAPRLGLNTFNLSGGVIVDDFDDDDDLDIVTSTFDPAGQLHYFRQEGDGTFTDRTREAGLLGLLGGLNMVQADYDNDGHLDFYVIRGAWLGAAGRYPDSLVRNRGGGVFTDVTFDAGLENEHWPSQTAAWADYDQDGDLDLYVGNESGPTLRSPCLLLRQDGGKFTDVAAQAGVENYRFTKGVVWGDYDGDRWPDLYVSNLGEENRLYRNRGDGTFADVAPQLGVTLPVRSFPVWFWDFNQDGALDLFVSSYCPPLHHVVASYLGVKDDAELACLYQGDGHGGFRDVAREQNLRRLTLPMGSNFGDLDNDGFPDFYLGTGYPGYEGLVPNVMYRNRGGTGFSDVTTAGGFGHLQKGHGVAFADLDGDGDQDVFEQMGGAYPGDKFWDVLFENPGFGNHWLKVKLTGVRTNRSAIGAKLRADIVEDGRERSIHAWVSSGGSFGANPLRRELGLGKATRVKRLEVTWPRTGETQGFTDIAADQAIEIVEGETAYRTLPVKAVQRPR